MPPSGFSQEAINGLLEFVRANYLHAADEYRDGSLKEKDFLKYASGKLKDQAESLVNVLGISEKGAEGLVSFISECFKDLVGEIDAGKDKYGRPVVEGKAIQKELDQIGTYLKEFTI